MIIVVELNDALLDQIMALAKLSNIQPPTLLEQLIGNGLAIQKTSFATERDGKEEECKWYLEKLLGLNPAGVNIFIHEI